MPSLFSRSELTVLAEVTDALAGVDRAATARLSRRFDRIVDAFVRAGTLDLDRSDATHRAELRVGVYLDVIDPRGAQFPEVRLQVRRRSSSAVVRTTRQWLGRMPPARVLVLTPRGYRLTTLRNLDAKRFLPTKRPRLALYKAASATNLSQFIDDFEEQLFGLRPSRPPKNK